MVLDKLHICLDYVMIADPGGIASQVMWILFELDCQSNPPGSPLPQVIPVTFKVGLLISPHGSPLPEMIPSISLSKSVSNDLPRSALPEVIPVTFKVGLSIDTPWISIARGDPFNITSLSKSVSINPPGCQSIPSGSALPEVIPVTFKVWLSIDPPRISIARGDPCNILSWTVNWSPHPQDPCRSGDDLHRLLIPSTVAVALPPPPGSMQIWGWSTWIVDPLYSDCQFTTSPLQISLSNL